jgi:CRP/FNR family transcriptional regulator
MTSLSAKQLMDVFPIFTADLAEFIHENGESKIFKPGEVLMKPGQFFKYAMLIVKGKVKLYREGEEFFMYFWKEEKPVH